MILLLLFSLFSSHHAFLSSRKNIKLEMTSSWVVVPASLGGQALKNNLSASSYSEKVSSTCQLGVPPWVLNPPILRRSVFSEHNLSTIFQTTRQDEYCASFQIADQNSNAAVDAKEIREQDIVEPPSTEFNFSMPPWLALPERNSTSEQRDYSTKLNALENSIGLYRSRSEVEMVTSTIVRAFPYHNEVPQRMLCIDFLSLLVHYMEMNHIALCAAIWHFRTCYRARLTMISLFSEKNFPPLPFGPWSSTIPSEQINHYVNGLRTIYATHIPLKTNNNVLGGEFGAGGRTESDEELQSIKAIAMQASQLKYNEMMADLILSQPHSPSNHNPVYSVLSLDATSLDHVQSLLLSIATNGDWNALAIRTAACLFRLRGLRQPSSEVDVWKRNEARKALYIFAPLAHRLGMYKLKEEIEREGFRLLYSRQYQLVMCLYEGGTYQSFIKKGCLGSCHDTCSIEHNIAMPQGMKSLLSDVTARVKRILQEDDTFMDLIASVSVTARVKEPYSIWKKILRLGEKCAKQRKDMTIFDVPDALALRVVLRCRKLLQEEDDDTTSDRERALCYYVLQLCKDNLPSDGRVNSSHKDYIKNPKPNGYQSIHFRFKMRWRGKDWPFEIQIRSFEMHRVAEYGLAVS
jgi:ppGpp synthetase/RelA/SpoT-type nucleotidyltranferase